MVKRVELRIGRDSALTWEEMDSNLMALDSASPFRVSADHITYDGKVGIGPSADSTYHPTYHLDFNTGDSNNEATVGTTDADLHVHVDGPRSLKVSTNTQERLTLTTQGNLGISQPNPEFPLDIDGNARITGTFRGNQFRAFSFSDSDDLTISRGNITNAKRIVSTQQIDFTQLYDRSTGYKVDHIDSVITNDPDGFPTTRAVYEAMESDRSSGSSDLDSEHAWNVAEHNQLQTNLDSLRTETIASLDSLRTETGELLDSLRTETILSIDSEHLWNLSQHNQLQNNIDSLRTETLEFFDSEHAWNVVQHNQLQDNIDAEEQARSDADSDLGLRLDSEHAWNVARHDSIHASLDSEHAWNVAEHNILQSQFDNLTTDSVAEGDINLYYTNARVDARNDSTIDSDFLNNRMPLGNLSDVQLTTPDLNEVLQWNGSVWSNQSIGIVGTIEFRGTVDATVDSAPSDPSNGDFYINLGRGNVLASWVGLSTVDSGDGLAWDSNAINWRNLGKTSSSSVVRVQAGTAISVDETDTARPVVAVRKDVTDTWYYTQSQVDSAILVERNWNISEHNSLQSNIDAEAQARSDADSDIKARLDSEHAWNVAQHDSLQSSIDNLDSSLRAAIDSLGINIDGDLTLEISNIQSQIDSVNDRIDSEHAWNVAQHDGLQSSIDSLVDSLNAHISVINNKFDSVDSNLNQLQININNLNSDVNDRLDSLQLYVDSFVAVEIAKLDSALDSEHAWNVREHGKLDSALDSEHAWNVSEHLALDSSLRAALDSLGENITAGLIISEDAPTDPSDGDLWMSTTEEAVYIYDGEFWFEFPGTGNTYASLAIGDTSPNEPSQGTMWMDNTEGVVKIYDGDYWFDWPWPEISAGDFGYLDSDATESMIDSALGAFEGGLDSASVQEIVDSALGAFDAPEDGKLYLRKDGAWVELKAGNGLEIVNGEIRMTGSFTGDFVATGNVTAYG